MEEPAAIRFKDITKIDMQSFLEEAVDFFQTGYANILNYYQGGDVPTDSFVELDSLLKTCEKIDAAFFQFSDQMLTSDMWDLAELFADIWGKLQTANNSSRWMRSSRVGRNDTKFYVNRLLNDRETFEQVARSLGSENPQDDWEDIAVRNLIQEEDYDATDNQKGVIFKVSLNTVISYGIENIVDNPIGDKILGKDMDKCFHFDNNDIATVEGRDAVDQTIDTILNTMKGSIPEFPEDGADNDDIGANVIIVKYPSLFRNLLNMFSKDARFKSVTLLSLERVDDYVMMKLNIETVDRDSYLTNIKI